MSGVLLGQTDDGGFLTDDGRSHLLTIAPHRSGRVSHCLTPNLLTYPGRMVVLDIGGEAYAATAETRRRMGQTVVRLDPFGVAGPGTDALDPCDLLTAVDLRDDDGVAALTTACQDLADLLPLRLATGDLVGFEAFGLLSALLGYLWVVPEKAVTFEEIYQTLHTEDVVYSLAVVLDTIGKKIPKTFYSEIAAFLQKPDAARLRILGRLNAEFTTFGNPEVREAMRNSRIYLRDFVSGDPATMYLILPVERLALHSVLLRVWVGALLQGASQVPAGSGPATLFLLDNCGELGPLPLLESILRLGPSGGYRIWTFWHDLHQLRTTYPVTWPAIVAGCGAVQVFPTPDPAAAAEAGALLGVGPNEVGSLGPAEQLVRLDGAMHRLRTIDPQYAVFTPTG